MTIKTDLTRRSFMKSAAAGAGAVAVPMALTGCGADDDNDSTTASDSNLVVAFGHGVASGDPLHDRVIIWTRVTPSVDDATAQKTVPVDWKVATDAAMNTVVASGSIQTTAAVDYTVKIDADGLSADTTYYYQFTGPLAVKTVVGQTKTLPVGTVDSVKLAVCSCANYPAGYFNAYDAIGKSDADVVVHLGDYIYEYAVGEYGTTANTIDQGRNHSPEKEIWTLADYRQRYGQYRQDGLLQGAHQVKPFICVWDDHELANDTYKSGAANHTEGDEGTFEDRRTAAFQAYHEWLPIRTGSDVANIYRNFKFGELVSMNMMDTRHIARDEPLSFEQLLAPGADAAALIADEDRRLIGTEQLSWLMQEWTNSTATWEVLGQQVLMGRTFIPAEILQGLGALTAAIEGGVTDQATLQGLQTTILTSLTTLAAGKTDPSTASAQTLGSLQVQAPYNLDAWDGYFIEREQILYRAHLQGKNVISLAGDTHNAWASDLRFVADTSTGELSKRTVGAEFATSSVTSPGFDQYLSVDDQAAYDAAYAAAYKQASDAVLAGDPADTAGADAAGIATGTATADATRTAVIGARNAFEGSVKTLVDDLQFFNSYQRGYMEVEFTPTSATAEWMFVDTIQSPTYTVTSGGKQRFTPGQTLKSVS
jgi:alkaline phosphatase D